MFKDVIDIYTQLSSCKQLTFGLREPSYNIVVRMREEYTAYYDKSKRDVFNVLYTDTRQVSAIWRDIQI